MAAQKAGELARYEPEMLRTKVVIAGADTFAEGLVEALKSYAICDKCGRGRRQPWAYRTFAKIAKLVDAVPQVQVAILQQIGVDLETARKAVRVVQNVEAKTEVELEEEAVDYLRERGWTVTK